MKEQLGVDAYQAVFATVTREQLLAFDRRKLLSMGLDVQHANVLAYGECGRRAAAKTLFSLR